jgi:hypothetical protein
MKIVGYQGFKRTINSPSSKQKRSLEMTAVSASETLLTGYQTAWCHMPKGTNLHSHHHENLGSHLKN